MFPAFAQWVSGDSFCRFTAVYAEQAGDDRKCKIFVFPEYYAGAGGFCGAGCTVAEDPGRTDNETENIRHSSVNEGCLVFQSEG